MSSTNVTLHNESNAPIVAELWWGCFKIDSTTIKMNEKGHLNCEYVWYDLYVYQDIAAKPELARRTGVYGYSSWVFTGTKIGDYHINPD